jgi:hypothetical protein
MSEIQIESGIPIPKRSASGCRRPGSFAYLIEILVRDGAQEDSILLPYREDPIKTLRCVRSAAYGVGKEYGFKTPIRREDGGIRVWKGKPRNKVVEQEEDPGLPE